MVAVGRPLVLLLLFSIFWSFLPNDNKISFAEAFSLSPHSKSKFSNHHLLSCSIVKKDIESLLGFADDLLLSSQLEKDIACRLIPTEEDILERVKTQHDLDYEAAIASPVAIEEPHPIEAATTTTTLPYEWISEGKVAAQSLEPVLNPSEIAVIRHAVETLWTKHKDRNSKTNSRFTYQFKGNSEAHAADFAKLEDGSAIETINRLLIETLYPWIRALFLVDEYTSTSQLYVYDSLFIRYNASASDSNNAGQPLHRDLGIVSVNIMLNDDFQGGGTYFDNQFPRSKRRRDVNASLLQPLKPSGGPGHCIAHYSNERHAGAGTVSGVRDILVFFISAKEAIPSILTAHLKQTRNVCNYAEYSLDATDRIKAQLLCRIRHQKLAVATLPEDGEAFLYLGSALMEYAQLLRRASSADESNCVELSEKALQHSLSAFVVASELTPNDARIWNNWGIALARFEEERRMDTPSISPTTVANVYQTGLDLLVDASMAGCAVDDDLDAISLNYGLYLANQNSYEAAAGVLERPALKLESNQAANFSTTVQDAHRLWTWCRDQMAKSM